jgi:hypothetical protein
VTELAVSGNTLRSISLTWIDPADADLEHVLIRRAVGDLPPVSASDGVLVAVLNAHATKFTDRKLASGTSYSYAVFTTDRQQNLSTVSTITALTLTTDDHTGIKGVLTDQQGYPIAGAWAEVRILGSGDFVGQATTGADGSYRVANIAAGTYTVCFEITPQTTGRSVTGYLPGCYRQQPIGYGDTGTPVTVTAGKMTTGIRDYLRPGGAISGRVTDPSGGGIGNVDVFVAYPYPQFYFYSTTSAADGSYTITGLPADDYQICFDATSATGPSDTGYLGECYDNEPPYAGGTSIPVSISQTTSGIDATLALGGAITGTVTDPAGNPVDDVLVSLIGPSGGNATTDAQGNYRITGVAAGNYTVCLDGSYAISATAPYGYTQSCQDTEVQVSAGQSVARNGTVKVGGAIGGSVAGTGGSPVPGVWVNVFDSTGAQINGTSTDETGHWQLPGFASGSYTVCYDPTYTDGGYQRGCYDGQPFDPTMGTPVTIAAGQLTTVDGTLTLGAVITGTITDQVGAPLGDVAVTAASLGAGSYYYGRTDDNGQYTLAGIDAGSYAVCFAATEASGPAAGGYSSECYDNQPTVDTADPVTVAGTGAVTVNAELAPGAAITGAVTDPAGLGVEAVNVTATSVSTGQNVYVSTRSDGSYTVPGLAAGDYTICFDPSYSWPRPSTGYVQQCWQDREIPQRGSPVHVDAAAVTSGIDARLRVGGEITGTVTDASGSPLAYSFIDVYGSDGTYYEAYIDVMTNSSGNYTILGAPATPLVICFEPPYFGSDVSYQPQCYRNAPDRTTATPVTPTPGAVIGGIDAVLRTTP